jgi:hypothetical protein
MLNLRVSSVADEWTIVLVEQYKCFNEHAAQMVIVFWLSEWAPREFVSVSWSPESQTANTPGTESSARLTWANPSNPLVKVGSIIRGFPLSGILLAPNKPSELPPGPNAAVTKIIPNQFYKWNPSSFIPAPTRWSPKGRVWLHTVHGNNYCLFRKKIQSILNALCKWIAHTSI